MPAVPHVHVHCSNRHYMYYHTHPLPTKVFTFNGLLCTFASIPLVPESPHEVSAVVTPRHAHVTEQLEREGGRDGFRYSDTQLKLYF